MRSAQEKRVQRLIDRLGGREKPVLRCEVVEYDDHGKAITPVPESSRGRVVFIVEDFGEHDHGGGNRER